MPKAPPGFSVSLFAKGLAEPRVVRVAPSGDIFVAESRAGRVRVFRAKDGVETAETSQVFASGLNGQTITLTSGELLITKSLSITGPGEAELTISGNHVSRVFDLEQTGKNKAHQFIPQVSLSDMTISNGDLVQGFGGAILNNGACTLTITSSILSNNSAGIQGKGGAIYNVGTLAVNGCTLTGNSSGNFGAGGAIANLGTLTVSPSSLSASFITNNSAPDGGGILNLGTATLTDTILSGNSASPNGSSAPDGGGIDNVGTVTLNGCTLYGNSAGSQGGGIFNGGVANLSGCTLADNSAFWGGGIFIRSRTATISGTVVGPATVNNILLQGNSAQQGGGIYVQGGTLYVKNSSTITGNTAPAGSGPDVYNLGTVRWDGTGTLGKHVGTGLILPL